MTMPDTLECPIHNDTLKSLADQLFKFIILKYDYFQLWFLYKSDLRISTARKQMKMIGNIFKPRKNGFIFYIIDKIKVSRIPL